MPYQLGLDKDKNYYKYKNEVYPNDSYIHTRTSDAALSYNFPYTITGSNITKWDCILNLPPVS